MIGIVTFPNLFNILLVPLEIKTNARKSKRDVVP
jgi:hypothetical protein